MGQAPQPRSEPLGLPLPVAHHGSRADDQSRGIEPALLLIVDEQREGLKGFTKAHIVGETSAEPGLAQEAEPGVTGSLVGSQLGFEASRDRQGFELPVVAEAAEPATEPSLEVRLLDLQPLYLLHSSEPQAQGFGKADLALEVAFGEELQGGVDLFGVEAHPLVPQSHERGLERDEGLELLFAQAAVPEDDVPPVIHEVLEAHLAPARRIGSR